MLIDRFCSNTVLTTVAVSLSAAFILFVTGYYNSYFSNEFSSHHFYIFPVTITVLGVIGILIILKYGSTVRCTAIDKCALTFLLVVVTSAVVSDMAQESVEYLLTIFCIALVYYLARNLPVQFHLFVAAAIVVFNFYQIVVFSSQLLHGISTAQELNLYCRGTFDNPSMLAGLLVCSQGMTHYFFSRVARKKYFLVLICAWLLISASVIIILQSRAAMAGMTLIFICVNNRLLSKSVKFKRIYAYAAVVILMLVMTSGFLLFKQDSVTGRMLIYKVSLENVFIKPLLGYGPGQFKSIYPHWQAFYFSQHGDTSSYAEVAGNVGIAFNDLLNMSIELGFLGSGVFAFLIYLVGTSKPGEQQHSQFRWFKASIAGILAMSLFSYPLQCVPIVIVLVIMIAMISRSAQTHESNGSRVSPLVSMLMIILLITGCVYSVRRYRSFYSWNDVRERIESGDRSLINEYSRYYPLLKTNVGFLRYAGTQLIQGGKIKEAINILQEAEQIEPDLQTNLALGDANQSLGNFAAAEYHFLFARNLIPNRFLPRHRLFQLSVLMGDSAKAYGYARQIIDMPVKVYSEDIETMKTEAFEFAEKINLHK